MCKKYENRRELIVMCNSFLHGAYRKRVDEQVEQIVEEYKNLYKDQRIRRPLKKMS